MFGVNMMQINSMAARAYQWDTYFMSVAQLTAKMSHAEKLKVGAIAVRDRRIICTGYNGTLPGCDNCCEETVTDSTGFTFIRTKDETEHAERNLIGFAARNGLPLNGATLYITHAPCIECAKMIITSGFVEVIYSEVYKNSFGVDLLKKMKVSVCQL